MEEWLLCRSMCPQNITVKFMLHSNIHSTSSYHFICSKMFKNKKQKKIFWKENWFKESCHALTLKKLRNKGKCHYPASVPNYKIYILWCISTSLQDWGEEERGTIAATVTAYHILSKIYIHVATRTDRPHGVGKVTLMPWDEANTRAWTNCHHRMSPPTMASQPVDQVPRGGYGLS